MKLNLVKKCEFYNNCSFIFYYAIKYVHLLLLLVLLWSICMLIVLSRFSSENVANYQ